MRARTPKAFNSKAQGEARCDGALPWVIKNRDTIEPQRVRLDGNYCSSPDFQHVLDLDVRDTAYWVEVPDLQAGREDEGRGLRVVLGRGFVESVTASLTLPARGSEAEIGFSGFMRNQSSVEA